MTTRWFQWLRFAPIGLAVLFVLGGSAPARAQVACTENLRLCYFRAAQTDSFWQMWAMGIDCELTFTDCTRRAIIGR